MADAIANAGADQTIDLSAVSLPQNINLTGGGTYGTGGTAFTSYLWDIVSAPVGSTATLSSTTAQNPVLNGVNVWGNYMMFLVVTDDAANVSSDNPYTAPNSARMIVKVQANNYALEKTADGEKDTITADHAAIGAIDSIKTAFDGRTVNGISDVTTATGPYVDNLCDGSYGTQNGSAGGADLHLHDGNAVDAATTSVRGAAIAAEAPVDVANPKFVTQDRAPFSGYVDTVSLAGTVTAGKVGTNTAAGNEGTSNCHWIMPESAEVTEITASMSDAGTIAGGGYVFTFYKMTQTQFTADNFGAATTIGTVTIGAPSADNEPDSADTTGLSVAVSARDLIVVKATTAPGTTGAMGRGAMLTAHCRRKY